MKKTIFRVGVIGPTNVQLIESAAHLAPGSLERAARRMGVFLANNSMGLISVPARGVGLWVLETYAQSGGDDSLALSPGGAKRLDFSTDLTPDHVSMADRFRTDLTWEESAAELVRESDCLVCIGLSCGTIIELAWTKWIRRPVLVVGPLMEGLPCEVSSELDVRLCRDIGETERLLLKLTQATQKE